MIDLIMSMSTAHLEMETFDNLGSFEAVIGFDSFEDGFGKVIKIPSDYSEDDWFTEETPKDLMDCIKFAEANNCTYIRFDGEAPIYDELPTYNW